MSIAIKIEDGNNGTRVKAGVTSIGQVIVAPYSYDDVKFNELAVNDTAYNFFKPRTGEQFVVTGIVAKADKQVSSSVDADVVVYEADSDSSITVTKVLFQLAMTQGDIVTLRPLNILTNIGKYINAKTTDDDIHMTITGYYIPKIS